MHAPIRATAGFTYLAVLFLSAILSLSLAASGMLWSISQRREKEQELLFIGAQFRNAIGHYYTRTPGTIKSYPQRLDDLLNDNRQLATTRYLRKIYRDPLTGSNDWSLILAADGGIMGIHSRSELQPLKRHTEDQTDLANAHQYSDWHFVYLPRLTPIPLSQ